MKRFLLLVALGLAPHFALAQPQPPAPNTPKFKISPENMRSVALIGAFYNNIQRAKSYNGHLVMRKTQTVDDKVVLEKIVDCKSAWLAKGDGYVDKRRVEALYTETAEGKKSSKDVLIVDDGETTHHFLKMRNVWSKQPHDKEDSDIVQIVSFAMWTTLLLAFDQGAEFTTQHRTLDDKSTQLVVSSGKGIVFVLDEKTGLLQNWRIENNNGETTEIRFNYLDINLPVPAAAFVWKQPEDAKQVGPEETEQKVEF
ncbi:hypothetical protein EON83_15885 [bacterium]|nr:MAG: hypothetical protein EON83_15885 [bacterium]